MNSAIRAQREAEDGFTLIELLVVVIIIGILAAIAIPAFLNQRERAWQSELTSTIRNVALEVEAEATAFGGDYTKVAGTTTATFAGFVTEETVDLQGGTTPVTIAVNNVSTVEFCLTGAHTQLTGASQVYESDEGGLKDFSPDGSIGCTDAN